PFMDNPSQRTVFNEVSGSFEIKDGVIRNEDLDINSSIISFSGRGNISLPDMTISMRLTPRDKGGSDGIAGIRTPLLISGHLLEPSFRLEVQTLVEDLIKSPKSTEGLVNQIKKDFEGIKENIKEG